MSEHAIRIVDQDFAEGLIGRVNDPLSPFLWRGRLGSCVLQVPLRKGPAAHLPRYVAVDAKDEIERIWTDLGSPEAS